MNRNIIQIYDFIKLFLNIFSGIGATLGRFLIGLLSLWIGIVRFDKSILPDWFNLLGI